MTKPRAPRWTADTELAFLMALRLTGAPTAACAAIGRSVQGTYKRRRACPAFAARWQQVTDELIRTRSAAAREADGHDGGTIPVKRIRHDGFTPLRRRAFLRALSETGRFEAAAAHVGVSIGGVTKLRRREPAFDADCAAALSRSTAILEQAAIERAVHGVEEPLYHAGKPVGTRRRYSDPLLRLLLQREDRRAGATLTPDQRTAAAHEAARLAGGYFAIRATAEETDMVLMRKLAEIEARRAARAAEDATREAPVIVSNPVATPLPQIRHLRDE